MINLSKYHPGEGMVFLKPRNAVLITKAGKGSHSAPRERLNRSRFKEGVGARGSYGQGWSRVLQHFRSKKHAEAFQMVC